MNVTRTSKGITVELELNEAEALTWRGGDTTEVLVRELEKALVTDPLPRPTVKGEDMGKAHVL